jgi:hypothetical protein
MIDNASMLFAGSDSEHLARLGKKETRPNGDDATVATHPNEMEVGRWL